MLHPLRVCVILCLLNSDSKERQLFQLAVIDDIINWRSICAGKNIYCKDAEKRTGGDGAHNHKAHNAGN